MNRCKRCDSGYHCHGSGTYMMMDQDGWGEYICQCSCAVTVRRERQINSDIDRMIAKYGANRVRARLEQKS